MKFDLKKLLKTIKLNEENISMVLGAIVLVVVGILVVNYFKDKKTGTITENSTQVSAQSEHTVVKGETLWSIAESSYGSGYNWGEIKKANNLTSDDIEVGQKLIIPSDVKPSDPTTTVKSQDTKGVSPISGENYVIVKGDCLWDIAVRAYGDGFKWTEIAKANSLVNPNLIYPGNTLVLPR